MRLNQGRGGKIFWNFLFLKIDLLLRPPGSHSVPSSSPSKATYLLALQKLLSHGAFLEVLLLWSWPPSVMLKIKTFPPSSLKIITQNPFLWCSKLLITIDIQTGQVRNMGKIYIYNITHFKKILAGSVFLDSLGSLEVFSHLVLFQMELLPLCLFLALLTTEKQRLLLNPKTIIKSE